MVLVVPVYIIWVVGQASSKVSGFSVLLFALCVYCAVKIASISLESME